MGYNSSTIYANKDDYFEFAGIDLDFELKSSATDNPTKQVEIFIKKTQTRFYQNIAKDFTINDELWSDELFKEALLWQIEFTLKNGETNKISDIAYSLLHDSGIINPSQQQVNRRWF